MDQKRKQLHQFDLSKLSNSSDSGVKDRTLSEGFKPMKNATEHINTKQIQNQLTGDSFVDKIAKLRSMNALGKKALSVVPMLGTAYAAMSGDPAMAADEMAGDVPVLGQAYEALKSEDAGNRDEERLMLAERNAQADYANSPARAARLKALQGFGR